MYEYFDCQGRRLATMPDAIVFLSHGSIAWKKIAPKGLFSFAVIGNMPEACIVNR